MKFFTDNTVECPYLLIKLQDYIKFNSQWNKKEVFIDPGVYELKKGPIYSWEKDLDIKEFLDGLPDNHFFSADKPSDMNPLYRERFLDWSWSMATIHCSHPKYIVTVQHPIYTTIKNRIIIDEVQFKRWFDRYNTLPIASGIMGIGNICRVKRLTPALRNCIIYSLKHTNAKRVHFYGLCLDAIPEACRWAKRYNIELSVDNTKWTKACTKDLKKKYGLNCSTHNRQEFFDEYMKKLEKWLK